MPSAGLALAAPAAAQTLAPAFIAAQRPPPTPAGPPPDFAFGAYQRGYFLTALHEAEQRVATDPKDAAAMTLIGEIYSDGYAIAAQPGGGGALVPRRRRLGDREAAFALGIMQLNGETGAPADRAAAKALFEHAAAKGQAGALYNLGVMALEGAPAASPISPRRRRPISAAPPRRATATRAYSYGVLLREGKGVSLDIGESARWLKRAADAGVAAGQVEYAIMLFNGVGVTKDEAGAAKLLLRAAARNNPIAENRLAHLYVHGRGVPKDLVEAATWNRFAKAAGIDDPDARRRDREPDAGREQARRRADQTAGGVLTRPRSRARFGSAASIPPAAERRPAAVQIEIRATGASTPSTGSGSRSAVKREAGAQKAHDICFDGSMVFDHAVDEPSRLSPALAMVVVDRPVERPPGGIARPLLASAARCRSGVRPRRRAVRRRQDVRRSARSAPA